MIHHPDEFYMKEALKEAHKALEKDEVPIGAIIVWGDRIISRTHNLSELLNDATAHAEMQAFTAAADYIGSKYLRECILYVTIEPCAMCAAASFWTQIGKIVYGAKDEKRGYTLISQSLIHPATLVTNGILEQECAALLKNFFRDKRQG